MANEINKATDRRAIPMEGRGTMRVSSTRGCLKLKRVCINSPSKIFYSVRISIKTVDMFL